MRISLLPILAAIALALSAPVASARLIDPPASPVQNLSSPDAQDANAAENAQTLQDLVAPAHCAPFHRADGEVQGRSGTAAVLRVVRQRDPVAQGRTDRRTTARRWSRSASVSR